MAKEEMMTILLLKGKQGIKTFNRHLKVVSTKDIPLNKVSLITTDNSSSYDWQQKQIYYTVPE
jgi:hypothetical protein